MFGLLFEWPYKTGYTVVGIAFDIGYIGCIEDFGFYQRWLITIDSQACKQDIDTIQPYVIK